MSVTRLEPGAITSCSWRILGDLLSEIISVDGCRRFDLMTLRTRDIIDMRKDGVLASLSLDSQINDAVTRIFQDDSSPQVIGDWFIGQIEEAKGRSEGFDARHCVSALATYLPDISSKRDAERDLAIKALANITRLALYLKNSSENQKNDYAEHAIIEIVCGTIYEPCDCPQCKTAQSEELKPRGLRFSVEDKFDTLCKSLESAIDKAREYATEPFYYALEVEPGDSYLLNSSKRAKELNTRIEANEKLATVAGFNLDIAHMKLAGIQAEDIREGGAAGFANRILHGHIADHPGAHTVDHAVGTWTNILQHGGAFEGEYYPYLDILRERLTSYRSASTGLPFSGVVALELEGGNRLLPIHHSLTAMRRLIHTAYNRTEARDTL